jgi:hypothetical protein
MYSLIIINSFLDLKKITIIIDNNIIKMVHSLIFAMNLESLNIKLDKR